MTRYPTPDDSLASGLSRKRYPADADRLTAGALDRIGFGHHGRRKRQRSPLSRVDPVEEPFDRGLHRRR